ncbi:hypothetical protein IJU97_02735 [bacterium]|nr:hypothetical protein [bacterium]
MLSVVVSDVFSVFFVSSEAVCSCAFSLSSTPHESCPVVFSEDERRLSKSRFWSQDWMIIFLVSGSIITFSPSAKTPI